jgi:alkylhydroperoxidase family enzyme
MFLLKHTPPEEAEGAVAEAYAVMPPGIPVPEPLQLFSISPEMARIQSQGIRYFIGHEKLDFGFFAMLRLVAAGEFDYPYCIQLNSTILEKAGGLSEEEVRAIRENPEQAPLEEPQKSLFLFVIKLIRDPESISEADIAPLRELGWSDTDIFDAACHAAMMQGPSMLFKAFRR